MAIKTPVIVLTKEQVKNADGEWVYPAMRNHRLTCCDCGLIHKMDFIVVDTGTHTVLNGVEIMFRAYRVNKRKPAKKKKKP